MTARDRHPFSTSTPVALLTGATSGIGRVAARALLQRGFELLVLARNPNAAQTLRAELCALGPKTPPSFFTCDLSDLQGLARCAEKIRAQYPTLHLMVHNAGCCFDTRRLSAEGRELTWTVNQLAPFLLTQILSPSLIRAKDPQSPSRIVVVASQAHHRGTLHLGDPHAHHRHYNGYRQYAFSKLANVMWTKMLDETLKHQGVRAYAYHPGVVNTNIASRMDNSAFGLFFKIARPLLRSPAQGAQTLITLACDPHPIDCEHRYYIDDKPAPISTQAQSAARAKALWRVCEQACHPFFNA